MDEREDEDLVEEFRKGDERAFQTLYDRYFPALTRFFIRKGCPAAEAEDVAHRTFLKFLKAEKRESKFDRAKRGFRSWIHTVAQRALIDHYRARRPDAGVGGRTDEAALIDAVAARETAATEVFDIADFSEGVRQCLDALPPFLRASLLAELDGKGLADIARDNAIPYGTAGSRRHTAHERMRRCLESKGYWFVPHGNSLPAALVVLRFAGGEMLVRLDPESLEGHGYRLLPNAPALPDGARIVLQLREMVLVRMRKLHEER